MNCGTGMSLVQKRQKRDSLLLGPLEQTAALTSADSLQCSFRGFELSENLALALGRCPGSRIWGCATMVKSL